ncbi:hypothetical protein [Fulvimonas yonginensis]|uniref:Uncharacterized protein n=1 Tax=Fulvimonas yonginensis TaxID=1495200 RepID=A0ABU8JCK3_9GAMM
MARAPSNDERAPDPAGVDAGPQSGPGGAGGEPSGAALQAQEQDRPAARHVPQDAGHREHSSDTTRPGYRARPAGQSGVGLQEDRTSALDEPPGEGNYIASDQGDKPLRNG